MSTPSSTFCLGSLPPQQMQQPAWHGQGVLGPAPQAPTNLLPAQFALNHMSPSTPPPGPDAWILDTGVTFHMSTIDSILLSHLPSSPTHITVRNGNSLPISSRCTSTLPTPHSNFVLNNVLVVPSLIRNLLSVRQLLATTIVLSNLTLWVSP
jgi:hypothetical protein